MDLFWRRHALWLFATGTGLSLALLLLAVAGALSGQPPALAAPLADPAPMLVSVSPSQAYNDLPTVITLTGSGFAATPAVWLNHAWLEDVGMVDSTMLTATVPPDLPGGAYTVTVTNPDGQSASLADAFTVARAGVGTLGVWQTTSSMRTARSFAAVVAAGDYVYALGGWDKATTERAFVNPDGSLGAWQALTATMTTKRAPFGAAVVNGYIYVVGSSLVTTTERALIQADGTLGAWKVLTATLNVPRQSARAVATDRFLYVIGGVVVEGGQSIGVNAVERAAINADGTLSPWQTLTATLNIARGNLGVVQTAGYIYVIGGMSSEPRLVRGDVERAAIHPDGTLGPWQTLASHLAQPRYGFAGIQAAGNLYAIGGQSAAEYQDLLPTIEVASILSDGDIGPWQTLEQPLNTPRIGPAAVLARGRLYTVGGASAQDGLSSVEQAVVNPPSLFSFDASVVPNTAPTDVTVWGDNMLRAAELHLPDSTPLPITPSTPYSLTATIPAGLAPGWYTATLTMQNGLTNTRPYMFLVQAVPPVLPPVAYLPLIANQSPTGCGDYSDNFDWPGSGWRVGNDGWVLSDYLGGEYWVLSEETGYVYFFYPPTCRRQNYTVEADVRWAGTTGSDYGLIFGRDDSGRYYLFAVSADYGDFALYRRDPAQWVTLQGWTVSPAVHPGSATNHLQVTRNGSQIRLELNGDSLGTWTDGATSGPTRAGVYSTAYDGVPNSDARFDNFRITYLPGLTSPNLIAGPAGPALAAADPAASAEPADRAPAPEGGRP